MGSASCGDPFGSPSGYGALTEFFVGNIPGWELHLPAWPTGTGFREGVKTTLEELIKAGCRVAWVGAEGIPFCDPPGMLDPECMTGGVLAWLTSDGWFGCPLDPDRPLESATDEEMLRLRDWAGRLATSG